ncbi:MAG: TIGR01212 family radical SAM protein [Hahellaceae bacterium]|nr:TIGR01212 family radical SAM protein [Hahellaceae bacterium]
MDLTQYATTLGSYLKAKWGVPVHKVSVNGAFTCPNRDGNKGIGGCTFCNNASFSPSSKLIDPVAEQIVLGQQQIRKRKPAEKFIAYFQAYTNTYADIDYLKQLYDSALTQPGIIGMSVGTRPDCVPDRVLALLASYQQQGHEIWLELGLQSARDESLARVNRGHGFAEYEDAIQRAHAYGLKVCTHLIVGLPGELADDSLYSLDKVLALGVEGLKIHPLHVVKGTQLARQWKQGEYRPMLEQDYVRVAAEMVARTPRSVVFHRLTGTASEDLLLAPEWCRRKWTVLNAICDELARLQRLN